MDYGEKSNHTKGTYGKKETDNTNDTNNDNNYIENDVTKGTFNKEKNNILFKEENNDIGEEIKKEKNTIKNYLIKLFNDTKENKE